MDEGEFRRCLELFPVVRPRDYHVELDPSKQSTSRSVPDLGVKEWQDAWEEDGHVLESVNPAGDLDGPFWEKLKLAAERKMGAAEARRFCKAFQQVHQKLGTSGRAHEMSLPGIQWPSVRTFAQYTKN